MMWAADFDEAVSQKLEEKCPEPLLLRLRNHSGGEMKLNGSGNSKRKLKKTRSRRTNGESLAQKSNGARSISKRPFCGFPSAHFWAEDGQMHPCSLSLSTRNSDEELQVFCVAAILIINRQKIMRETHSIDDVIKASSFSFIHCIQWVDVALTLLTFLMIL